MARLPLTACFIESTLMAVKNAIFKTSEKFEGAIRRGFDNAKLND
jgi:hypothetical protein